MFRALLYTIIGLSCAVGISAQDQRDSQQSRDREIAHNDRATAPDVIPGDTEIPVRTDEAINVRDHSNGRTYPGTIAQDVMGRDGTLLIPRGSGAELSVRNVSDNDMMVDLESITVNGRRYTVNAASYDRSRGTGLGKNKRTGEYVGGGAVLGTVIGAIAGGGKGAAIGAVAGGAAGAGAQVATRGKAINIPAETVLRFRLNQSLELGSSR